MRRTKMTTTQGGLAVEAGKTLERIIEDSLSNKGFTSIPYREYIKKPAKYGNELLLKNVPYNSIYGHNSKSEFVLKSERYALEIRIECKWQQSKGSVDEKFPYVYLNCIEQMPEKNIFIIVDGGGAKAGAIEWLRKACETNKYIQQDKSNKVQLMSISDFVIWINQTIR